MNDASYTLNSTVPIVLSKGSNVTYYLKLVNISFLPIADTITIDVYAISNGTSGLVITAVPSGNTNNTNTTTVAPTTTVARRQPRPSPTPTTAVPMPAPLRVRRRPAAPRCLLP